MVKQKKSIIFLSVLALFMLLNFSFTTWGIDAAMTAKAADIAVSEPTMGNGSADNPYQISTMAQLYWFAQEVNSGNVSICAKLTGDITVNGNKENTLLDDKLDANGEVREGQSVYEWIPIGSKYNYAYTGTFDGQGHTIKGLYINDDSNTDLCVGLFGHVGNGGKVSNVIVDDSYFNGDKSVGGICGKNEGTIQICTVKGKVNGNDSVGGICGWNNGGTIKNSTNESKVIGSGADVGGVCGSNTVSGLIDNNRNTGAVSGKTNVGGVCGSNTDSGLINNSCNTGAVTGTGTGTETDEICVGGVCGKNEATIKKSYNDGAVTSTSDYVGGVCGENNGIMENIYNTGAVKGEDNYIGGVCGYNFSQSNDVNAEINYSYNSGTVEGKGSYIGGVCGYINLGILRDSYYDSNVYTNGKPVGSESPYSPLTNVESKSTSEFNSGFVTYLLNGSTSEEDLVWGQIIGTDDYPVFNDGENTVIIKLENGSFDAKYSTLTKDEEYDAQAVTEKGLDETKKIKIPSGSRVLNCVFKISDSMKLVDYYTLDIIYCGETETTEQRVTSRYKTVVNTIKDNIGMAQIVHTLEHEGNYKVKLTLYRNGENGSGIPLKEYTTDVK